MAPYPRVPALTQRHWGRPIRRAGVFRTLRMASRRSGDTRDRLSAKPGNPEWIIGANRFKCIQTRKQAPQKLGLLKAGLSPVRDRPQAVRPPLPIPRTNTAPRYNNTEYLPLFA